MTTIIDSETELEVSPALEAVLAESSGGGDINMSLKQFSWPSIGTLFRRAVVTSEEGVRSLFTKTFTDAGMWVVARGAGELSLAEREHILLNQYKKYGCPVPKSKVSGDILIMEDCGNITLTSKLYNEETNEQEVRLTGVARSHALFIAAGRTILSGLPNEMQKTAEALGDISQTAEAVIDYWRPGASEEDRRKYCRVFSPVAKYVSKEKKQLILGDTTTYHIFIDANGDLRWIDLERARIGHPTRSSAGYLFSPEVKLSLAAKERVLRVERQTLANILGEELTQEKWIDYLKCGYVSYIVELGKRAKANRKFQVQRPDGYKQFIEQSPGFVNAQERYSFQLNEVVEKIRYNGLYSRVEKNELGNAGEATLELMAH